jgi:hypothetical protein
MLKVHILSTCPQDNGDANLSWCKGEDTESGSDVGWVITTLRSISGDQEVHKATQFFSRNFRYFLIPVNSHIVLRAER